MSVTIESLAAQHNNSMDTVRAASKLLTDVSAYRTAAEAARLLYEDRVASRFSPFDFMRLDELGLSRVIGWLLDPRGSHAQRGRFLQAFTALWGDQWTEKECDDAEVALEQAFKGSRIDILVRSQRTLAIENKPWAADQPNQLGRYLSYLAARSSHDHRLIYLTPEGSEPSPESIATALMNEATSDGRLVLLSYDHHILNWLDQCRLVCRAPRVSSFLEELKQTLAKLFIGISDVSDIETIAKLAVQNSESIRSALQIANAQSVIQENLLDNLRQQLLGASHARNWELVWSIKDRKKFEAISFDIDRSLPFLIQFEFYNPGLNGFYFGVKQRQPQSPVPATSLTTWLDTNVGKTQQGGGNIWPWFRDISKQETLCRLNKDWGRSIDLWADIPAGMVATTIMNAADQLSASVLAWKASSAPTGGFRSSDL